MVLSCAIHGTGLSQVHCRVRQSRWWTGEDRDSCQSSRLPSSSVRGQQCNGADWGESCWSGALAGMENNPTIWSWESAESGAICLVTGGQNIGTLVLTEVVTKTRHNVQYCGYQPPWPGRIQRYQVHTSQTFGGKQSIEYSLYFARHKHGDYVIFSIACWW